MMKLETFLITLLGICAACHGREIVKDDNRPSVFRPEPDIPDVLPPEPPSPPKIPMNCIGGQGCKLTWPTIDYKPSQPNYYPLLDDRKDRMPRHISNGFPRAMKEYLLNANNPNGYTHPKKRRERRSPVAHDRSRSPVIVPYFCHKMPCSGPLSSVPLGKGESSGRYQLPVRQKTFN